jgi:hypothetical protein
MSDSKSDTLPIHNFHERPVATAASVIRAERRANRYVRTIPLNWIQTAARLPGKSLQVGIALWHLAGVTKRMTVRLTSVRLTAFGVRRSSKRRALATLAAAGLVKIDQDVGRNPLVTICTDRICQTAE